MRKPVQCYHAVNPPPLFPGAAKQDGKSDTPKGQCMTQCKPSVQKENIQLYTRSQWAVKWAICAKYQTQHPLLGHISTNLQHVLQAIRLFLFVSTQERHQAIHKFCDYTLQKNTQPHFAPLKWHGKTIKTSKNTPL